MKTWTNVGLTRQGCGTSLVVSVRGVVDDACNYMDKSDTCVRCQGSTPTIQNHSLHMLVWRGTALTWTYYYCGYLTFMTICQFNQEIFQIYLCSFCWCDGARRVIPLCCVSIAHGHWWQQLSVSGTGREECAYKQAGKDAAFKQHWLGLDTECLNSIWQCCMRRQVGHLCDYRAVHWTWTTFPDHALCGLVYQLCGLDSPSASPQSQLATQN